MKKIAILHGRERSFPQAFIERVNQLAPRGVTAEPAHVNKVAQGEPVGRKLADR